MTDDDDWPYIVDDILQMTLQHSQSKLDNPPKSLSKSLLNTCIKNIQIYLTIQLVHHFIKH